MKNNVLMYDKQQFLQSIIMNYHFTVNTFMFEDIIKFRANNQSLPNIPIKDADAEFVVIVYIGQGCQV